MTEPAGSCEFDASSRGTATKEDGGPRPLVDNTRSLICNFPHTSRCEFLSLYQFSISCITRRNVFPRSN